MKNYVTSDLSLAAFLMMKGYKLLSAGKQGNRFEFIFEDKNNSANSHALEYVNSEFCKFDNHLRSLRKILYKN